MFACLCSGSRAEGLVFWPQIHHLLLQQWGEKNLQALAKCSAFEKLPLARNQQGAVKNLVAKSSEDPDHMGCALFQSIGRWAGFFPYVPLQAVFPGPDSEQGTLCRVTVFFFLRLWERDGESCQPVTPGEEERGFKKLSVGENGIGSSWDMDNGDEDGMRTAGKQIMPRDEWSGVGCDSYQKIPE